MQKELTELEYCLCCDNEDLRSIFDLGKQPLANNYHNGEPQEKYPLRLNLCRSCWHVQLAHAVDPKVLFENYAYRSGIAKTMHQYYNWFAVYVRQLLPSATSVLDIASNDGSQLDYLKAQGFETWGIDPAKNLKAGAEAKGHHIIDDYFTRYRIERKFDAITAQNVLAHVSNPGEFLEACRELMYQSSVLFVQTSQAEMIREAQFDTIYHEHISFFNVNSMRVLVEKSGLRLVDVLRVPVHGKSYVFVIQKQGDTQRALKVQEEEKAAGYQDVQTYMIFQTKAYEFAERLKREIAENGKGRVIVGYGAAAKGTNLLNFVGIHPEFIIDDTPEKQNKFAPGVNTPILPPAAMELVKDRNVLFMPLAWNFYNEIKARIQQLRQNPADRFLQFCPEIKTEGDA